MQGPITHPGVPTSRERRVPLTGAQQRLAADYLPLARALAKPLKEAFPAEWHEFESAACLALVEAAEAFDPGRNIRFATFARHRIRGALLDASRKLTAKGWRCDPDHAPGFARLAPDAEEYGRVLLCEPDGPVGRELEAIEAVEDWLRKLPPRYAAACRLIYLHGKTHADTARHLGISQSRVTYMHLASVAMLSGRQPASYKKKAIT